MVEGGSVSCRRSRDKADHSAYIVREENWHVSHPEAVRVIAESITITLR